MMAEAMRRMPRNCSIPSPLFGDLAQAAYDSIKGKMPPWINASRDKWNCGEWHTTLVLAPGDTIRRIGRYGELWDSGGRD